MPAEHDLDPPSMTEEERLAKRRYQAYFAFETMDPPPDGFPPPDPDEVVIELIAFMGYTDIWYDTRTAQFSADVSYFVGPQS